MSDYIAKDMLMTWNAADMIDWPFSQEGKAGIWSKYRLTSRARANSDRVVGLTVNDLRQVCNYVGLGKDWLVYAIWPYLVDGVEAPVVYVVHGDDEGTSIYIMLADGALEAKKNPVKGMPQWLLDSDNVTGHLVSGINAAIRDCSVAEEGTVAEVFFNRDGLYGKTEEGKGYFRELVLVGSSDYYDDDIHEVLSGKYGFSDDQCRDVVNRLRDLVRNGNVISNDEITPLM